jgi:hypothetical protein
MASSAAGGGAVVTTHKMRHDDLYANNDSQKLRDMFHALVGEQTGRRHSAPFGNKHMLADEIIRLQDLGATPENPIPRVVRAAVSAPLPAPAPLPTASASDAEPEDKDEFLPEDYLFYLDRDDVESEVLGRRLTDEEFYRLRAAMRKPAVFDSKAAIERALDFCGIGEDVETLTAAMEATTISSPAAPSASPATEPQPIIIYKITSWEKTDGLVSVEKFGSPHHFMTDASRALFATHIRVEDYNINMYHRFRNFFNKAHALIFSAGHFYGIKSDNMEKMPLPCYLVIKGKSSEVFPFVGKFRLA